MFLRIESLCFPSGCVRDSATLFDTSVPNINLHISNILKENELDGNSVIKQYLTTASDGKDYNVAYYSLQMRRTTNFSMIYKI